LFRLPVTVRGGGLFSTFSGRSSAISLVGPARQWPETFRAFHVKVRVLKDGGGPPLPVSPESNFRTLLDQHARVKYPTPSRLPVVENGAAGSFHHDAIMFTSLRLRHPARGLFGGVFSYNNERSCFVDGIYANRTLGGPIAWGPQVVLSARNTRFFYNNL